MMEIPYTAKKKIHESVISIFSFNKAFTRASENSSKLHTRSFPKTLANVVRALSSSDLMAGRRKRGALGRTKVSACGNIPETSFVEDREGPV